MHTNVFWCFACTKNVLWSIYLYFYNACSDINIRYAVKPKVLPAQKNKKNPLQIKHAYGVVWVPALRSTLPLKLLSSLKHNDMISC